MNRSTSSRLRDGFRVARLPAYGKRMAFTSNQDGGDDMDLGPVDRPDSSG